MPSTKSATPSPLTATLDSTADGVLVINMDSVITASTGASPTCGTSRRVRLPIGDEATKLSYVLDQLVNPQVFTKRWQELELNPDNESFETLEFKDGRALELTSKPQTVAGLIVGRVLSSVTSPTGSG